MSLEEELSTKIAGEIVLSSEPGKTIKKWREMVGVSQSALADALQVSPPVISDYERMRRTPGSKMVNRIVKAIVEEDIKSGSNILKAYSRLRSTPSMDGILDMKEFSLPMTGSDILEIVKGEVIANEDLLNKDLYGYTALDSVKVILGLSSGDFYRIYGLTSERALVFTNVSSGRSPFIAIRVSSIKPGLVVLQGIKKVDALGIEIAERERVPVVLSSIMGVEDLLCALRGNTT